MRSYTERLRVPAAYWWLGMFTAVTFASFVWAGFSLLVAVLSYVVICGGCCAVPLLLWGRTTIEVSSGELRPAGLPCRWPWPGTWCRWTRPRPLRCAVPAPTHGRSC
jgi:hypothetical protein